MFRSATGVVTIDAAQDPRSRFRRPIRSGPVPWMLPAIVVLGLFYLYPVLDVLRLSFTDATLIGDHENYTFASIANTIGSSRLPGVLLATLIFVGGSIVGQQIFGLILALIVIRGETRGLLGTTLLRIVWQMLFSEAPFGAINSLLRLLHMSPVAWLSNPAMAPWSAVIANIWRGTAFSMVVMYAARKGIDPELYEAAEVDGASSLQRLLYVTLPMLRPAILVNMILITIQTMNTFDAIISLTGGGPGLATEVISLYTFNIVFRNYDLAGGSVMSVLMLMISLTLAVIYAGFLPREEQS